MADISNELKKFKEAAYGEDVRDAMVSAIQKINTIAENITGVAVKEYMAENASAIVSAIEDVVDDFEAMKAQVEHFTTVLGDKGENTLWTGDAYYRGEVLTLLDVYSNYDYIDFYTYDRGQNVIKSIPVSCFSNNNNVVLRSTNVPDYSTSTTATDFQISEMIVKMNGSQCTIHDAEQINSDNGTNTRVTVEQSTTINSVMRLQKIVGRIVSANYTELADIRYGANGTTYQTAGDAVRGQLSDLADTIDAIELPVVCDPRALIVENLVKGKTIDSNGNVVDSDGYHFVSDVIVDPTNDFEVVFTSNIAKVGYAVYRSDTNALIRLVDPDDSDYAKRTLISSMYMTNFHYVYKLCFYFAGDYSVEFAKRLFRNTWNIVDELNSKQIEIVSTSNMSTTAFENLVFENSEIDGDVLFNNARSKGVIPNLFVHDSANTTFLMFTFQSFATVTVDSAVHKSAIFAKDCRPEGVNQMQIITINYDGTVTPQVI